MGIATSRIESVYDAYHIVAEVRLERGVGSLKAANIVMDECNIPPKVKGQLIRDALAWGSHEYLEGLRHEMPQERESAGNPSNTRGQERRSAGNPGSIKGGGYERWRGRLRPLSAESETAELEELPPTLRAFLNNVTYYCGEVQKRLAELTCEDFKYLAVRFRRMRNAMAQREEFADEVVKAMQEYGVDKFGELPIKVLERFHRMYREFS